MAIFYFDTGLGCISCIFLDNFLPFSSLILLVDYQTDRRFINREINKYNLIPK